jgi:hypothetical protein
MPTPIEAYKIAYLVLYKLYINCWDIKIAGEISKSLYILGNYDPYMQRSHFG